MTKERPPMDTRQSFLEAYQEQQDAIFRFCLFKTSDRELARDLSQEVFLRAWDYADSGKIITSFKALFYKIAGNLVIDYYRKKKESSLDEMMEAGFDPGGENIAIRLEGQIDAEAVTKVLKRLDPQYRDIIVMRYIEDMAVKDIAAILGERENNISVKIYRGLNQLRELIKE
jgi:RNA polymerase sigma-70 factor, ECF subfamily